MQRNLPRRLAAGVLAAVIGLWGIPWAAAASEEPTIHVEIAWDAMAFDYEGSTWDPEELTYSEGSWTSNGNTFTISNNSNVSVEISCKFEPENECSWATAVFSGDGGKEIFTDAASTDTLEAAAENATGSSTPTKRTYTMDLSGIPDRSLSDETIGSIVITLVGTGTLPTEDPAADMEIPDAPDDEEPEALESGEPEQEIQETYE